MKLSEQIFEALEKQSSEDIKKALNQRIFDVGLEGVEVAEVSINSSGEAIVSFIDEDKDSMDVLFSHDPDDGAEAILLDEEDDDDDEFELDLVNLDALDPKLIALGGDNKAIDLIDNSWMNKSLFETMFGAGDLLDGESDDEDPEDADSFNEKMAIVIRNGKRVKVALTRRKRKKRLTAKQRAGIKKATRGRKKGAKAAARKRKKSLKIRKRSKLKKKDNKKFKVGGA